MWKRPSAFHWLKFERLIWLSNRRWFWFSEFASVSRFWSKDEWIRLDVWVFLCLHVCWGYHPIERCFVRDSLCLCQLRHWWFLLLSDLQLRFLIGQSLDLNLLYVAVYACVIDIVHNGSHLCRFCDADVLFTLRIRALWFGWFVEWNARALLLPLWRFWSLALGRRTNEGAHRLRYLLARFAHKTVIVLEALQVSFFFGDNGCISVRVCGPLLITSYELGYLESLLELLDRTLFTLLFLLLLDKLFNWSKVVDRRDLIDGFNQIWILDVIVTILMTTQVNNFLYSWQRIETPSWTLWFRPIQSLCRFWLLLFWHLADWIEDKLGFMFDLHYCAHCMLVSTHYLTSEDLVDFTFQFCRFACIFLI